ncbi:MAG: DUF4091 domain-containing protein [Clostridia bacterium]|nr:DUF4091 domain-containing protein [Clostridia bacterium]
METVRIKSISSLEKRFPCDRIDSIKEYRNATALKGERFSYQIVYVSEDIRGDLKKIMKYRVESPIKEYVRVSRVDCVPVRMPMYRVDADDYYMSREPGLYPDLLVPLNEDSQLFAFKDELFFLRIDVEIPYNAQAGIFPIRFMLIDDRGDVAAETEFSLEIIDASLPEQEIKVTQWFHADCLASYYRAEVFSEEHWRIIGEFIKTAVKNGINMILTPVLTPALDTAIGGERPTVQLVDVFLNEGKYSFAFEKLDRWVALCLSLGVKYFEIAHLFTQWGAEHAPKVMATVDGEYKRIFGWETEAAGEDYTAFLKAFLPALKSELTSLGVIDKCSFHLSDEPGGDKLKNYLKVKAVVEDALKGCTIMDALSDYSFYESGALDTPVVSTDHVKAYLDAGVKDLWVYYCCCQYRKVSNRLVAMPQARNRIIGTQFFKYRIAGFLQWGYNFYFTQYSVEPIDPYHCTDGGYFVPAGDAFSVYPAPDGTAYETLHLAAFTEALYDLRAMKLLESLAGYDAVMEILEDGIEPITFDEYPHSDEYILKTREKINRVIGKIVSSEE